jgi:alpha-L-fucosidase
LNGPDIAQQNLTMKYPLCSALGCKSQVWAATLVVAFALAPALAQPDIKLARPSPQQYAWHEQERIMFVCLDPCTWQGREYDNHSTPLQAINPTRLDTDQWCQAAKLWGAREILLVAKHTGGFCWWQTGTTQYGIKDAAWRGGKGDVLADLSASCRKHGINLGIYVYPGDDTWGAPMGSGGRTRDPAKQDAYNKVFRQQLTEVLTRYGKITEVWFDGSCVIDVSDILKQHAADAVVFQGPQATIRWPGTESGKLPYPAWNSLKIQDLKTGVATAAQGDPDGDAWAPLEADTTLYNHNWFWSAENENKRKSLDELMDIYMNSAGRGGVLLLNSTPNTDGLIPADDMKLYQAFGREIERRFSQPVAEINDQRGICVELALPRPTAVNHVVLMEDFREGERIREYVVEGLGDGQWKELSRGSAVGRKKIDCFSTTQVGAVRLRVTRSAAEPIIRRLAVFQVDGVPAGSQISPNTGTQGWQRCGNWTTQDIHDGKVALTIDLSPFIPKPGQYEIKFEESGDHDVLHISRATLLYEGEEATPGLLTGLSAPHTYNVNRTAQVTKDTSSVLKVDIAADGGNACDGAVWIRPRPLE